MTRAPLWLRVAVWAAHRPNAQGDVVLGKGELRTALDPTGCMSSQQISHAIRAAVRYGLLHPGSNARLLRPTLFVKDVAA